MTRDDLHIAFKIEMDKNAQSVAYGGCPAFLPEEVDYWINKAYYDVITTKFSGLNVTKTGFEGSVKRTSDLERLVRTDKSLQIALQPGTNQLMFTNLLNRNPNNKGRLFFIQAVLHFKRDGKPTTATIDLVNHENAKKFTQTYNNVPWIPNPVATIEDNSLLVYIDPILMAGDFTIDITYIKHPTLINELPSDTGLTEVPETVQNEIVNKAVQLALDNIESQRIQTKTQLNELVD